jgi:hypothetical protein
MKRILKAWNGYLPVIATRTAIAATFPSLLPLEFSEFGDPRAMKIIDLGRDRITVTMYSQNFMPVHANRGLARSMLGVSIY